ncbi:hypothetical protein KUTeg_023093 [Tegillarca granosa]|uniref:Uncharacterized protein n=1 Tax=Tegillarca granosa TaxID=220873 RepID=A0ABQ9E0N5_TEGGR|nr:hypothetical protein KUTeg_023093 [Tegillarca granosa]
MHRLNYKLEENSGNVYSWGRNDYGQLGRSCDGSYDHIPGLVTGLKNVASLSCGSEHNLALTDDGTLFSWGWNEHGICGTGDEINVKFPHKVAALKDYQFYHVGCGAGHSFAIGSDVT